MKHKNYDMIVAKAANMELTVFIKHNNDSYWESMRLVGFEFPDLGGTHDYFMCLQKHSKQTLEWLNNGDVQGENPNNPGSFDDYAPYKDRLHWSSSAWYMRDDRNSRIKPKKENRWIATFSWAGNDFYVTPESFSSESELNDYVDMHYGKRDFMQIHQIEGEV